MSASARAPRFEAVLFDWMLTLAHYPSRAEHIAVASHNLGRSMNDSTIANVARSLAEAEELPEVEAAMSEVDTSVDSHHAGEHLLLTRAGIDKDLADEMYRLLGRPDFHPLYPDVKLTLAALADQGLAIGVVSDIHVDLRRHALEFGIQQHIAAWTLSFELGIQKPSPRMFEDALDQLGTDPERTLMVGDSAIRDGAAEALGITCMILPPPMNALALHLRPVLDIALLEDQ